MGVKLHIKGQTWAQDRVLRLVIEPKREEVRESLRKQQNYELHHFHCSPNAIRVTKSRRLTRAGHAARKREKFIQEFCEET
jgi:predicted ATP-grasp superfamily ATP-dependent carboligase